MDDVFVGTRRLFGGPDGVDDLVVQWRREWERGVATAEAPDGAGDARLAAIRRDYGSLWFIGLDALLALFVSIVLVNVVALVFYVATHDLASKNAMQELAHWQEPPLLLLLTLLVGDGAMLLVLWHRLARQRLSWSTLGINLSAWREHIATAQPTSRRVGPLQAVLFGLGVGVVGLVISAALGSVLQGFGLNQNGQDKLLIEPLKHAPLWIVLAMVFAGTFVAPVVEEVFFRGYVFRAVAVRKGVPRAYLISAGVFALFHLTGGPDILPLVPVLFVIGLLLCFAYRSTGNLLADITAHAVNNGAAFAVALLAHL